MIKSISLNNFDLLYKNYFDVIIDNLDFTRLYTNSILLNSLSKEGTVTLYANKDVIDWVSSLQKSQTLSLKYTIYSNDISFKSVVYDGNITVNDVVFMSAYVDDHSCSNADKYLTIDLKFTTNDRHVINS
jgi:hypothetical protein